MFSRYNAPFFYFQFSSVTPSCPPLCDPKDSSTPGFPVHHQLLEPTQTQSIESVMPSNHLILCCPLLFQPSIFSSTRVFSNESVLRISWPNYWSFSFNISPSKNIQDWFPLGWTGWISLQSKRLSRVFSNATVQKHQFFSAQLFFVVQLSHPYMTTGEHKIKMWERKNQISFSFQI